MAWRVLLLASVWACVPVNRSSLPANVAAGLAAAAIEVSSGGCVATCTAGTSCNAETGLCERPCDDACGPGEHCQHDVCVPLFVPTTTAARAR